MVPTCWIWVRKIRRYGRQLRKYVVNIGKCASVMVPVFLDVVGNFVGTGDN
jgi:hypothetical protein